LVESKELKGLGQKENSEEKKNGKKKKKNPLPFLDL